MRILREVSSDKAIGHALWEAHACIGQWAFCACLAMLRKALDLWSADYSDRNPMTFDHSKGERDILFWRLRKIAEANALYRDSIHKIIDGVRIDANDAVHNSFVCAGTYSGTLDGPSITALREPVQKLHHLVVTLIKATRDDVKIVYSDERRWRATLPSEDLETRKETVLFDELEKQLPDLFAEMRTDLQKSPFIREFVLLGKQWGYNGDPNNPVFRYYFEEHADLKGKMKILQNHDLIKDIKRNQVDRYLFTEEFAAYLLR